MTTFGNYSSAVEEVIAFVENHNVLAKPYEPIDEQIGMATRKIFNLDDVDRYRDPDWPNAAIASDMAWIDIQRTDQHLFSSKWSEEFTNVTQPALEPVQRQMWQILEDQFSGVLPEIEIGEIDGFFRHLQYLRGASGQTDSFDERLYKVYQAGGYPCGWAGSFPEGELIVFSRE